MDRFLSGGTGPATGEDTANADHADHDDDGGGGGGGGGAEGVGSKRRYEQVRGGFGGMDEDRKERKGKQGLAAYVLIEIPTRASGCVQAKVPDDDGQGSPKRARQTQ